MSALQANRAEVLDKSESCTILLGEEPPGKRRAGNRLLILVERKEDWASYLPSESLMLAQDYLEHTDEVAGRTQVINLCRHYKYLGQGYYCSLLAEARGTRYSSVRTISELSRKALYGLAWTTWSARWNVRWPTIPMAAPRLHLTLYFGKTPIEPLQALGRQLFEAFPAPSCWWSSAGDGRSPGSNPGRASCATRKISSPTPWTPSTGVLGASRNPSAWRVMTWPSCTTLANRCRLQYPGVAALHRAGKGLGSMWN
jgi:hypothetical protein